MTLDEAMDSAVEKAMEFLEFTGITDGLPAMTEMQRKFASAGMHAGLAALLEVFEAEGVTLHGIDTD